MAGRVMNGCYMKKDCTVGKARRLERTNGDEAADGEMA